MRKRRLIGIVVLWVGLLIAAVVTTPVGVKLLILFLLLGATIAGVLIYLASVVRKKKAKTFYDEMEPKLAEKRSKMLETFLLVAGISLAASMIGYAVSNILFEVYEIEDSVSFLIGFFGLIAFFIAAIGSLVIFLRTGSIFRPPWSC